MLPATAIVNSPDVFQCFTKASLTVVCARTGSANARMVKRLLFMISLGTSIDSHRTHAGPSRVANGSTCNPTSKMKRISHETRPCTKECKRARRIIKRVTFRACASSMQIMSAFLVRTKSTKRRDGRAVVQPAQRDKNVTAPTSISNLQTRTPAVLVVDNDPLTLHLAAAILHRAGYDILRANSGAEALIIAYQPAVQLDLLVTAAAMPNMSDTYLAAPLLTPYQPL